MKEAGMEIVDCNNHVKSATNFFGPSCAVNSLKDKYNPIGDNSDKLCLLCIGKIPGGRCTDSDPYAGYDGAFRCLLEAGEVAFLKHNTVQELVTGAEFGGTISKDSFELFCRDGTRRTIDDYRTCNWGTVPSDAIVTSSASTFEIRQKLQKFLEKASEMYSQGIQLNSTYDDRNRNFNTRNEYDQFGNRIQNRFKRQSFGTGNYNDPNQQQYDPTKRNEGDVNNRQFDPNYSFDNNNQYGQGDYNRQYGNQFQNNQLGVNERNRSTNPYATDPFSRDPYKLNKDQYGVNIDPYESPETTRDRNRETFLDPNRNNTGFEAPGVDVPYNGTYYEVFNMFESAPKYGIKGNLLFQVN